MKDCYMSQPDKQRLISNTMNEVFRLRKLIAVLKDGPESEGFSSTWVMGHWCETFDHFRISKQELIRQTEAHIKHIEQEAKTILERTS
jgi:chromosome condensin MukBEF MukE localization factor